MHVVTATVQDPHLYALSSMDDGCYRGLLVHLLNTAIHSNVMLTDDAGLMRKCLSVRLGDLAGKYPVVSELLGQCLKRQHAIGGTKRMSQTTVNLERWTDPACDDEMARIATLSLAGEPCVEAVYASKGTLDIANCEEFAGRDKVRALDTFEDATVRGGVSIFGKTFAEVESEIFGPILKWGATVTVVDKQIGNSFSRKNENANWNGFKQTIGWLYRCWVSRAIVPRRRFEILTHPARDATGRMGDPSMEMAQAIWEDLGAHNDLRVEIIKEGRDAKRTRNGGDVVHPRYLVTMPMDFTLCVDRGFDLLGADGTIIHACNVALMPTRPDDLAEVFELRNSGASHPPKSSVPSVSGATRRMADLLL